MKEGHGGSGESAPHLYPELVLSPELPHFSIPPTNLY